MAASFNIKPGTLQSLPHFHGEDKENPYLHIKEFEEMVNTFCNHAAQLDVARMRLFPFSLKDKAKIWFNGLRSQSVRSWAEMQEEFFKKFFPIHRTTALKRDIQTFEEKDGESFNVCWNRYKDCLNAVPHHGYSNWEIVQFFYQGISFKTRQFIELMCNGTYLEKEPAEALEYLDRLAETNQSWDYSDPSGKSKQPMSSSQSSAGRYTLRETDDLNNKVTQLSRRLEHMELHKVNEVAYVARSEEVCVICERQGHSTNEFPTIPAFKEVLHGSNQLEVNALNQNQQRKPSNSPFSETYNPGWRDHPNFC